MCASNVDIASHTTTVNSFKLTYTDLHNKSNKKKKKKSTKNDEMMFVFRVDIHKNVL